MKRLHSHVFSSRPNRHPFTAQKIPFRKSERGSQKVKCESEVPHVVLEVPDLFGDLLRFHQGVDSGSIGFNFPVEHVA